MIVRTSVAVLIASILAAGGVSRADFSFSTTSGGTNPFDSAGNALVLTGQPASSILNFQSAINLQDVEIATATTPPNFINDVIPFSFTLNLVQTPGLQASTLGTGSETVTGSLLISRSDVGGELSSLVSLTAPALTIGNTQYTFANASYAPPTVNSAPNSVGAGNLSIEITPVINVPEPASVALLGFGAVSCLTFWRRRSRS